MNLPARPSQVRGLMDDPAYTQRILNRVLGVVNIADEDERAVIDLRTSGTIPLPVLEAIIVVWIEPGQHLAARVEFSEVGDGACRLTLRPWMGFVNHDLTHLVLERGIHLWLGAAWRHIPINN